MHRALAAIIVVLAVCLGALWSADRMLERSREERRAADSAFHRIAGAETPAPASVARIDLAVPGTGEKWTYAKEADGWRLPRYWGGFARGRALEGLAASFLEGRGTVVGRMPGDAGRFGIVPGKALEAELRDGSGKLLVHALAGRIAPGQRSTECFVAAEGRDAILHLDSNPWIHVDWVHGGRFPPLLDPRVTPEALGRGLPSRIAFGGESPPEIQALIRRELPVDPRMGPDRGPRYEWYGAFADGERRLNDAAAFAYTRSLADLGFEELLGPTEENRGPFARPDLVVEIEYDGGAKDSLILGAAGPGGTGARHLLHATTKQAFFIAPAGARSLAPDVRALLEPPPAPPPQPPPGQPPIDPQPR